MSRKAMQVALEALESDPISHAGLVTVLSPGKGTGCGYTNINENWTHLYNAPPKREWVSLTDEEIYDLIYVSQKIDASNSPWFDCLGFYRAIEAKLKERNI
jgi:hypothetical protein